jgi:hypothetical protein
MIDKRVIKNIFAFLENANIKGREVPAYAEAVKALHKHMQEQEPKQHGSEKEKEGEKDGADNS